MKIVKDKNGTRLLYYRRKDTEPVAYAEPGDECWTATAYGLSPNGRESTLMRSRRRRRQRRKHSDQEKSG